VVFVFLFLWVFGLVMEVVDGGGDLVVWW
jgi:hypothetical protein